MHIHSLVERFLRETGLPPTKFGRLSVRDPRLVFDMRAGREVGEPMAVRLREFMNQYRSQKIVTERLVA